MFTCCGIITMVRNGSQCDGQREEVTLDTSLGLWLVCYRQNRKPNKNFELNKRKDFLKIAMENQSGPNCDCISSMCLSVIVL